MNILLAYANSPGTSIRYLEKALNKKCNLIVEDLTQTPYWTDIRFKLPFYFPKGLPISIYRFLKKFRNIDAIIEIDTFGQYHITGLNKIQIPSCLWAADVYRFDKRKFQKWIANDFNYIFVSQKKFIDAFGTKKTSWLPYSCDPEIHRNFNLEKIYDIVFVGNTEPKLYKERVRLLELLKTKFNVQIFSNVYEQEMAKIFSRAKIVFNKSCDGELNLRVFETLSCGSLLLTDKLESEPGLEELFSDGKHLVLYRNETELLDRCAYFLEHTDEREQIAAAGQKEVHLKHTYDHRAEKIIETLMGGGA